MESALKQIIDPPQNICVIGGAGYVGLITGLGLSELGHKVVNVDVDVTRIKRLQSGESPIYESGIEEILKRNLASERIQFSTNLSQAAAASQIVIIAVGTPAGPDGKSDISQIISVIEDLRRCINSYKLVVIKSTAPVGTVDMVLEILGRDLTEGQDFDVAVNPEFLREGNALYDFFNPDRIVIGSTSAKANGILLNLYQPLLDGDHPLCDSGQDQKSVPVVATDPASAQMIKYASNAFLAARISFINEMAVLCDASGADIKEVSKGMGYDPRIGASYLNAGLGFGGPCLEKDLSALVTIAESNNSNAGLLKAILNRNQQQLEVVIDKLKQLLGEPLERKSVAVYGLAFKAGTDDVRNSMSVKVVDMMLNEGISVRVHDPKAPNPVPGAEHFQDPYEAAEGTDSLVILTDWPNFSKLEFQRIKDVMAFPIVIDARNMLDGKEMRNLGFTYVGIGTK